MSVGAPGPALPSVGVLVATSEPAILNTDTVTAAHWDTVTSGLTTSAAGVGRTTAELADPTQLDGWDLTTVWAIDAAVNGGDPHLRSIAGR